MADRNVSARRRPRVRRRRVPDENAAPAIPPRRIVRIRPEPPSPPKPLSMFWNFFFSLCIWVGVAHIPVQPGYEGYNWLMGFVAFVANMIRKLGFKGFVLFVEIFFGVGIMPPRLIMPYGEEPTVTKMFWSFIASLWVWIGVSYLPLDYDLWQVRYLGFFATMTRFLGIDCVINIVKALFMMSFVLMMPPVPHKHREMPGAGGMFWSFVVALIVSTAAEYRYKEEENAWQVGVLAFLSTMIRLLGVDGSIHFVKSFYECWIIGNIKFLFPLFTPLQSTLFNLVVIYVARIYRNTFGIVDLFDFGLYSIVVQFVIHYWILWSWILFFNWWLPQI